MAKAVAKARKGFRAGGVVRSVLAWSGMVRLGGISLALGGATVIAVNLLSVWLTSRELRGGSYDASVEWLWTLADWVWAGGDLLVAVGLVGVYALLVGRRGFVGSLAQAGLLLAVVPTVCYLGLWLRQYLTEFYYYPSDGASLFSVVSFGSNFVRPAGILLLGVAVLWVRGLGRWRALLPILALMSTPLPYSLLFNLVYSETSTGSGTPTEYLLFGVPHMLTALEWLVLGLAMWNVRKREDDLLARGRRLIEKENLDRARRLYTGAWGEGNLGVLEDLVSLDVVDHGRGERGREAFGRGVADLRRSFPDLRFEIEVQTAEGDEVVTRWTVSGTDRGGVLWYPPTGREVTFTGTFTDRFSEGQIVEHRGEPDMDGLLGQLGLPRSRQPL